MTPRPCAECGAPFQPVTETSEVCSGTCMQRRSESAARLQRTREKLEARIRPEQRAQGHLFRGRLS